MSTSITVVLDVFSGRPNPRWEISRKQYEDIMRQVEKASPLPPLGSDLGYRGFSLLCEGRPTCTVGNGIVPQGVRDDTWQDAVALQRILLSTAPPSVVYEETRRVVEDYLAEPAARHGPAVAAAPVPNDAPWNDPHHVTLNNCYNYACDMMTDTFAQPGRTHGFLLSCVCALEIRQAAMLDGLEPIADYPADDPAVGHYVALGYSSALRDYHWWRLDSDGTWSHKPGQCPVMHTDASGGRIDDLNPPSGAGARGCYEVFAGYFYVPETLIR